MPINLQAIARQGRASIYHQPPTWARVAPAGVPFPAEFHSKTGELIATEGGIVYDRGGDLIVSKLDLPEGILEQTYLDLMLGGVTSYNTSGTPSIQTEGEWVAYRVDNVSGMENPSITEARLSIGPANG